MTDAEELVARVLSGERAAVKTLVDRMAPVIWARAMRVVQRGTHRTSEQVRQLSEDLVQEVFAALFQDEGRALRAWAPSRGLSLEGYVGLLAEHQAASILRSGRRSGWREDPATDDAIERQIGASDGPADRVLARDTLLRVLERVRLELSPLGLQMFEMLVVEERPVAEVCAAMGMNAAAVHAWRSRIGKLVAKVAGDLEAPPRARVRETS